MTHGFRFEAEIAGGGPVPSDAIGERCYGALRVVAAWPEDVTAPEFRMPVEVQGEVDRRDAPAYAELFFHDVFLLLNLSVPGSFEGTVSITGGELRARELGFSAHLFTSVANRLPRLPVGQVVAWYDALEVGSQQAAGSSETAALFHLLRLSRAAEDEEQSIIRLAAAAEALQLSADPRLFALRDDVARGRTPVFHPMHDDALDPRVEDATREWIEVAAEAALLVIGALQQRIRNA